MPPPGRSFPLDDPVLGQRVGARSEPQAAAQGREREEEVERGRGGAGLAAPVEVQVEVVVAPHQAVAEAVTGHGELQRHEEVLVGGIVEAVADLYGVLDYLLVG